MLAPQKQYWRGEKKEKSVWGQPAGVRAAVGMARGSVTDTQLNGYYNGTRPKLTDYKAKMIHYHLTKTLRLTPLKAQILVVHGQLSLRLDVVCATPNDDGFVVIEVKTTQDTDRVQVETYHEIISGVKTLANGMPNTTYGRHQLQAGFGRLAFAAMIGPEWDVQGRVVVANKEQVRSYASEPQYSDPALFTLPVAKKIGKISQSVSLLSLSLSEADRQITLADVTRMGYTVIAPHKKVTCVCTNPRTAAVAVVALVNVQSKLTLRCKGLIRTRVAAVMAELQKAGSESVRGGVIAQAGGVRTLHWFRIK